MNRFTFRLAEPGEEDALSALCMRSKAHWGYDSAFLEATREDMTVKPNAVRKGMVLVAERTSGETLGVSALGRLDGETLEIDLFFLEPEAIGAGLGRRLFEETAALARKKGGRALKIVADPNAEAFYAHMGARRIGDEASSYIPGRRLPLMTYEL